MRDIIKEGDIFKSRYGDIMVTQYHNSREVDILFVDTMYETTVMAGHLRGGSIKDKLSLSVCGIGYMGDGEFNRNHQAYVPWKGMFTRCYSSASLRNRPNYVGCSVCEEWHNFQNFAKWYLEYYPNDGEKYQVDKDIKVKGNKVYSPSTCMFVSNADNSIEAKAKHYSFVSPDGELMEIYNLKAFCRDNGLTPSGMYNVALGNHRQHKGWTSFKT